MSLCQLNPDMKIELKKKLVEIYWQVDKLLASMDNKETCLLCRISEIKDLAHEVDTLASAYHLQSSFFPYIEGMDEIVKALAVLSQKHHGMLLAIEQNDSLEPLIATCKTIGVAIGAKVSSPLLQTIFYPGGPLHDGSVVIRNGEIVFAGCVFPLSDQKYSKEGQKIGTRHRAALGLSERSDALVIVVSEETGQVSFAIKGTLHPIETRFCEQGNSDVIVLDEK